MLILDDYYSLSEQRKDIYDQAIETCYLGQAILHPSSCHPYAIGYRNEFFGEMGLDPEKVPDTWEDLQAMASPRRAV